MRQHAKQIVRRFMAKQFWEFRIDWGFTQEQMAELLWISPRSYIDLEHGKYQCAALTAFLFLLCLEEKSQLQLFHEFQTVVREETGYDVYETMQKYKELLQKSR